MEDRTKSYVEECTKRVIDLLGKKDEIDLGFDKVPMSPTLKPELDESPHCTTDEHCFYQQLIGISGWLVTCRCLDLCFAVSSFSRFLVAPRQGHQKTVTRIFKYLNCTRDKWIFVEHEDIHGSLVEEVQNR